MAKKHTLSKVVEFDKATRAIHEAGHAVVALALGAPYAHLTLFRDITRDLTKDVAFQAQCRTNPLRGKLSVAALGYAGVIADILADDPTCDEHTILENLDFGFITPSPTDLVLIGRLDSRWHRRAIKLALQTLKSHWTSVRGLAFELQSSKDGIVNASPSDLVKTRWNGLPYAKKP